MTVLVAVASRHGATHEIAETIGRRLVEGGLEVDVQRVEDVRDPSQYDAVVLGSAVYVGRWLKSARAFVDAHAEELAARPTWLFSSGPIGDPPKPEGGDKAVQVEGVVAGTHARGHRVFAGRIDRSRLNLAERAVASAVRAADGDFRAWPEVEGWAGEIAAALRG